MGWSADAEMLENSVDTTLWLGWPIASN